MLYDRAAIGAIGPQAMDRGNRRVQRIHTDGDQPRGGHEETADDRLAALFDDEGRCGSLGRGATPVIAVNELHGPPQYAAHGVDLGRRQPETNPHLRDVGPDQFIHPLCIHLADEDPDFKRPALGNRREPSQRSSSGKCRASHKFTPCYGHSPLPVFGEIFPHHHLP